MPRLKEPSIRAKKYIQNKISGMSDYQSAIAAGYSPNTAIAASQKVENSSVKKAMAELMDEAGLTDEKLVECAKKGLLESTKIHGTNDNFVEIPDYQVRHKYLETALKIKGKLNDNQIGNITVNILDYNGN